MGCSKGVFCCLGLTYQRPTFEGTLGENFPWLCFESNSHTSFVTDISEMSEYQCSDCITIKKPLFVFYNLMKIAKSLKTLFPILDVTRHHLVPSSQH